MIFSLFVLMIILLLAIFVLRKVIWKKKEEYNPIVLDDRTTMINAGYSEEVISALHSLTGEEVFLRDNDVQKRHGFRDVENLNAFEKKALSGIGVRTLSGRCDSARKEMRYLFREPSDYICYVSQSDQNELSVLKTSDQFDVLRYERTNGINHEIHTEAVISKLQEWDNILGINIYSAGEDFVAFGLSKRPKKVGEFAQEVFEFCPDSVHQGAGSVEKLRSGIWNTRQVFLWWD